MVIAFSYRRAQVMAEAWERGLGSRAGAANLPVAFDNCSGDPRRGKRDRSRKAIGTGADDGGRCHKDRKDRCRSSVDEAQYRQPATSATSFDSSIGYFG